ncbi:MAG: hypothetical protein ACI841_000295 [Planctomycetota bacterium]|jgi:hypothetical protein
MNLISLLALLSSLCLLEVDETLASDDQAVEGVRIPSSALGIGLVETVDQMRQRSLQSKGSHELRRARNDAQGEWIIPSRSGTGVAHSGEHYALNQWGDTLMGIGFGDPVQLVGVWVGGNDSAGSRARGLRAVGFLHGDQVAQTEWYTDLGDLPSWFEIGFDAVDRVEFQASAALGGAGWFALDDLTFVRLPEAQATDNRERLGSGQKAKREPSPTVVNFDDLPWRTQLTGSKYAGLTWERGRGDFTKTSNDDEQELISIPPPIVPASAVESVGGPPTGQSGLAAGPGTAPDLLSEFVGMRMFENGTAAIPADTCGAVGPNHFVSVVNVKLGVFDKVTGARLFDMPLPDFFQHANLGDPRVTYDHHAGRWFVLASSGPGTARLYLAVSMSDDPTGSWYKTYIDTAVGADVGRWPDYPTIGYDAVGLYATALMVPSTVTIFAIDKAPLLSATPSLGVVTAFRDRPFEGATQPCVTYGDSGGEIFVSRQSATRLRMRQLQGPISAPTLGLLSNVAVPGNAPPFDAPALGSQVDLDTGDARPMNAVYRNGSVYTTHSIRVDGRAAVRWYELDAVAGNLVQYGTAADPVWHYSYPSISVNAAGHMALGFSGSHAGAYASNFYTGRHVLDPLGATAQPVLLRAGAGPYNHVDGNGAARWGDYSLTSVDPVDDATLWTIQKYGRVNNRWGTWIAELGFTDPCPSTWTTCVTSPNSAGNGAYLSSSGGTSLSSNSLQLIAAGAPPQQNGLFFYAPNETVALFGNGVLCASGGVCRLPIVATDAAGQTSYALDVTQPPHAAGQITPGSTWFFQFWYRDPAGGGSAFNLSDALGATFCP